MIGQPALHPTRTVSVTRAAPVALLAVDMQAGFMPGGNLAVAGGDRVVEPLIAAMQHSALVILSRDWHPADHISFVDRGGPWPAHCVQGTADAELDRQLLEHASTSPTRELIIVSKGMDPLREAYSAFEGVNLDSGLTLAEELHARSITRLRVGGLATDYCVRASVLDALAEGLQVELLESAVRAVNVNPEDGSHAIAEMRAAGAKIL